MDKNKQIKELIAKGFTKNQAAMICLSNEHKMQQGGFTGARLEVPSEIGYNFNNQFQQQSNPFENTGYANYSQNLEQKYPMPEYNVSGFQRNTPQIDYNKEYMEMSTEQEQLKPPQAEVVNQLNYDNLPQDNVGLGLYTFGQGLGDKDPWKISTGAGLTTISGARELMSGLGTGRESARVRQEMQKKQFEDMRRPQMVQEGGHITNADKLTGRIITDEAQGNVELEKGEIVKDNTNGDIKKVEGDWHKDGGVKTTLEDAKVHSNYTKWGAKNAKELSDKYKLSVKKTDTPAKTMDKFNDKLGINELIAEQAKYIEKVGENETIKSEGTKKVNDEFSNKKIKEIEDKLQALKGVQNYVFEDIFARQEQIPKRGDGKTILDAKGNPIEVKGENQMAQEGGHIYNLASKYGISPERAMQLLQEGGGIQSPQEEQMEGQASNPQEEQGEASPEQIVADALSKGAKPEEILQYLVQNGFPEDQAKALIQEVSQQLQQSQNPQEEQAEGNMSNPQEEQVEQPQGMMQEGGYAKKQQATRLDDFYKQVSGLGYQGKKDIGNMQNWMADNYPQQIVDYFTKSGQPLTAKHVDIIKNKYKDVFKNTGISASKKSEDYTAEEKLKLQTALGDKANQDFILSGFKDNKWDWRFPTVSTNLQAKGMTQGALAQLTAPSMNRFTTTDVAQPQSNISPESKSAQRVDTNSQTINNVELPTMSSDFILPPSAMQAINKQYIPFDKGQPVGISSSAALQEIARQNQTALESLRASGLPPQIVESIAAGQLSTTHNASEEAIGKVNQYNAQNQYLVDQENMSKSAKERLLNAQNNEDYQNKMNATINAYEGNLNRYFIQNNLQNRQNKLDNLALNTVNDREHYNINRNGNISYVAPQQTQTTPENGLTKEAWDAMTAQQQKEYLKNIKNASAMKNYKKTIT